ncbi:MAG: 5-formyltetrahydrofolate cyclo-ligase [Verrucomicrobia bacterium]|nr:5-formyltetrahydrofolate cyclo-ligase [Verrucomicrobiota bacterium]MDE3100387.1 5-formyltetrahydrofolate cyclo-ligase [Verrucomicrobiota bacterium]
MNASPGNAKGDLRTKVRKALARLSPERRAAESAALCARLKEQALFKAASSILFFAPLPHEVDIWPLLEAAVAAGKAAALPCFDPGNRVYKPRLIRNLPVEIVAGRFGIREPAPLCLEMSLAKLDLALVPGVAFDLRGNRLGRGRGFYDGLLRDFPGKKIGIAFDEQMLGVIPAETTDVKMDFILTPRGLHRP